MSVYDKYETVIGLECHIQLLTNTKMYSGEVASYGGVPNTQTSVVTLGHPGSLPVVNRKAIEFAVRLGLAVNASIRNENQFARKNYFYADLPKGYQITQDKTPICTGGFITSKLRDGTEHKVNLIRIHMEEDAGKSLHDIHPSDTLIDLNRAGTPLLEIVTEPDLRSGDEAYSYLTEIRKLVRYLDICDGNMEEGSLRCDANISVRLKGETNLGKKVEVKNMNSFRNVQRAIDHEAKRQIDLIEAGGTVLGQTRSYDAVNDETFSMRTKEGANDYRYFPEPDLQPVFVNDAYIAGVKASLPELPGELFKLYTRQFKLSDYDAMQLTDSKEVAAYFGEVVKLNQNYKAVANWLIGPIRAYLNEKALHFSDLKLLPSQLADIVTLIDSNQMSASLAAQQLLPALIEDPHTSAENVAARLDILQNASSDELKTAIEGVLAKYPGKVIEYKNGKTGLIGLFVGEVMKQTRGKADPKLLNALLKEIIDQQ